MLLGENVQKNCRAFTFAAITQTLSRPREGQGISVTSSLLCKYTAFCCWKESCPGKRAVKPEPSSQASDFRDGYVKADRRTACIDERQVFLSSASAFFSKYFGPIEFSPTLLERLQSFILSGPTSLSLDDIRLNIQHTSNDFPSKKISFWPSKWIFNNMS